MEKLFVICPLCKDTKKTERLKSVLEYGLKDINYVLIEDEETFRKTDFTNSKIIFSISLGQSGINLEYYNLLKQIRLSKNCFKGAVAGVIVDGKTELYTKNIARELIFSANQAGCAFPGRSLVEGTEKLQNFNIIAKIMHTNNYCAYKESVKKLIHKVLNFDPLIIEKPKILALHTANTSTSNTLALWEMVKKNIDAEIIEICLWGGEIVDCRGCPYETCLYFGEKDRCFYGGVITKDVYPAVLECDGLVMVCANYNDAVSANITAFINRLTALVRSHSFEDKRLFGVIVSGYSGSDILATQLISSLSLNKGFMLPPRFSIMETANDPNSIYKVVNIEEKAKKFAYNIMRQFNSCK